jgi:uncharacterized protein YbjT (DUF2867 family)
MTTDTEIKPIFVAGATGYIGGRLVPRLLEAGYHVRALARAPEKLQNRTWAEHPHLEIVQGDVLDVDSLRTAMKHCRAAYYLVHSMNPTIADFAATDRLAARNMAAATAMENLEQIVYLSGLGDDHVKLSHHLQSRTEVGAILKKGSVPVTILRAAMIIGSGSASFEILRYLVDRLPVMITPRWIDTPCQPIGIRNVLHYLVGCIQEPQTLGETFDIGQPEVTTYRELMRIYAEEAGLPSRLVIPVPVLTPRLSSYWIHLVTPVPASIARPLAEGLSNPVICHDTRIASLLPQERFDARKAIRLALDRLAQQKVETSWIDSGLINPAEWSISGDPDWAGGSIFADTRRIILKAEIEEIWPIVSTIGGSNGYYYADWLWTIRGIIDRLFGGVGLNRGRRSQTELHPGDALDFWRVSAVHKPDYLMLVAEMKLPGEAVLTFRLTPLADGELELVQSARFLPRGLFGIIYWYTVLPFHHFVFNGMLRGIAETSGKPVLRGPEQSE